MTSVAQIQSTEVRHNDKHYALQYAFKEFSACLKFKSYIIIITVIFPWVLKHSRGCSGPGAPTGSAPMVKSRAFKHHQGNWAPPTERSVTSLTFVLNVVLFLHRVFLHKMCFVTCLNTVVNTCIFDVINNE